MVRYGLAPSNFPITDQFIGDYKDSVWCSFSTLRCKKVGCVYRAPSSSSGNNDKLARLVDFVCETNYDYKVLVWGF